MFLAYSELLGFELVRRRIFSKTQSFGNSLRPQVRGLKALTLLGLLETADLYH
jgi:hypothetical protein